MKEEVNEKQCTLVWMFFFCFQFKFWMQSQDKVSANTSHWASCHICTNTHVNMTKATTTTCQYVDRRPLFELHLVFLGFRSVRTTTVNGADVEDLFTEWKWKCSVDIFQNLSCAGEWLQHFEHVAAADNLALFCERHWDCLACSRRFTTVPTRPTFGE